MKQKHILTVVASILCIFIFGACKSNNDLVNSTTEYEGVKIESFMNYSFISKASFYKQSTILCKGDNKLFRFGTDYPVQVYDLGSNAWTDLTLQDSTFGRWDGGALNINDTVYIVAVSRADKSYDILKYDPKFNKYEHTGVILPDNFDYPAYCKYNDQIYFLSVITDSVCRYNVATNKLSKIAENPFHANSYYVPLFSSGNYQNYFYVLKSSSTTNSFYRLNLLDNNWEKIAMPKGVENRRLFGASMGSQMILFCDSLSTFRYEYDSQQWSVDTSYVPIYPRNLIGKLDYGEWSFYSEDTCLYGSEIWSQSLWKISLK